MKALESDNIGGRYSVLTPQGFNYSSGSDIYEIMEGAKNIFIYKRCRKLPINMQF